MINHADIENIIGCKTLVTDRMQRAFPGIRFFRIHLYFNGFYIKMQG